MLADDDGNEPLVQIRARYMLAQNLYICGTRLVHALCSALISSEVCRARARETSADRYWS